MASKRMFSKSIIENDYFMDLPIGAKALYFLLGMEADDEGFVSPKRVMKIYGGSDDDLKILIMKNFVIQFESGVIVITDWKENNYLDRNRIKETKYILEKSILECNNNKYSLTTNVKPKLNKCLTSIEENRIEENNNSEKKDSKIYIKTKQDIKDIFIDEPNFIENNQIQLYILYKMIELGYKLLSDKQKIKEDIVWLVNMITDYIPRNQDGHLDWKKARILTDGRYDYWSGMTKKPKNFKSSLRNSFNIFSK